MACYAEAREREGEVVDYGEEGLGADDGVD